MTGCKYEIRFGAVTADLGRSLGESGRRRGELWQNTGPATTRGSVVWWNHSQHMGQGVGQGAGEEGRRGGGEEERRRGGEEEMRRGRHFKANQFSFTFTVYACCRNMKRAARKSWCLATRSVIQHRWRACAMSGSMCEVKAGVCAQFCTRVPCISKSLGWCWE